LDGGGLALTRCARTLPHREQDRRAGERAELALGDRRPGVVLPLGGLVVAGEAVELDQQSLVVLVQRAHHGGPDGHVTRAVEVPTGEEPQGRLVQDRLGGGRQPSSLGQQPRLVRVGVLDREPLEQLLAQARELDRGRPVAADQLVGVHSGADGQRDPDRVTVHDGLGAEPAPDLREAPPQRPEGVVGLGEEERRELAARRRALAQQEERQQRPALPAAVAIAGSAVDFDARLPEQLHGQRRGREPR
jgi:hypothetical protein